MITISTHWATEDGNGEWQVQKRLEESKYSEPLYKGGVMVVANNIANHFLSLDWCDAVRICKGGKVVSEWKKGE